MRRHIVSKSIRLIVGISIVFSLILFSSYPNYACKPTSETEGQDISQTELPEKGNPKLDSQLNQLVRAETRGDAALFAEQSDIELIGSSVRVIIECVPGQLAVATEAATNAGANLETSHDDLLQAVVPISSLTTLANEESIHFIRLPQYPLPADTSGG